MTSLINKQSRDNGSRDARELQALGVSQLAYIKSVMVDGEAAFSIHAADGTQMALTGDREVALAAVRQHEMIPALVH